MNKTEASAPGKLMLFGEHAVVYDRPCLVTAVNQRIRASVSPNPNNAVRINAPDVNIRDYEVGVEDLGNNNQTPKGIKFVEFGLKNFFEKYHLSSGINVETHSDFSSQFGFGSSSAVTVALLKALSIQFNTNTTNQELFELAYKTVLDVQGVGSGFDLAAGIWGGTLYFVGGGKEITPVSIDHWPIVVGYTGIKADTATLVNQVSKLHQRQPTIIDQIFDTIASIVTKAKECIGRNNLEQLGELMNLNQGLLDSLGVSTQQLDNLTIAARSSGAWGAKLSGAGGGDCMIALVSNQKRSLVESAIVSAGGQVLTVEANAPGVRQE